MIDSIRIENFRCFKSARAEGAADVIKSPDAADETERAITPPESDQPVAVPVYYSPNPSKPATKRKPGRG
jgi:hypothetical protein